MIDATVLLLGFTDQYSWGFCGSHGILLNCSTDVDETWYGSLSRVFTSVIRYDVYRGANKGGICAANRDITEIAQAYSPRYVFYPCNFSGIVTEGTLTALRAMGCVVVADFFDDDACFDRLSRWMAPSVDYVITHVPALVHEYEALGVRCVPSPAIPLSTAMFHKLPDQNKLHDATFVGSLYPYRRQRLAAIAARGAHVEYLGGGNDNKVHFSRMVKAFNQSRINVNLSSGQPGRRISMGRVFEVPLCGGFLLTEQIPGLERWFDIGREIECFQTDEEAADKIRYYLEHQDERERIAARGHDRACREYAGHVVVGRVVTEIENDLRRRGRPAIMPPTTAPNSLRETDAEHYFKWVRALLRQPRPIRDEWYETARLVLTTNPAHSGARCLLDRAQKWRDPEPVANVARIWAGRARFAASVLRRWGKHPAFGSPVRLARGARRRARRALGDPSRFIANWIRRKLKAHYRSSPVPPRVLDVVHRVASLATGFASPLSALPGEINLDTQMLSDPEVRAALGQHLLTPWSIDVESLNWLVGHVRTTGVRRVLEFGSGTSTVALAVACRRNVLDRHCERPYVVAIEESAEYAVRTRQWLTDLYLDELAVVVHCPLIDREIDGRIVRAYTWDSGGRDYFKSGWTAEMLFVDGPSVGGLSRAVAIVDGLQRGTLNCAIVMDDALRDDEICAMRYLRRRLTAEFDGVVLTGKGIGLGRVSRKLSLGPRGALRTALLGCGAVVSSLPSKLSGLSRRALRT